MKTRKLRKADGLLIVGVVALGVSVALATPGGTVPVCTTCTQTSCAAAGAGFVASLFHPAAMAERDFGAIRSRDKTIIRHASA
jgi:hypothetical protein